MEENAAPQFDPNRVRFAFDALATELTRCEGLLRLAVDIRSIELRFDLDAVNGKVTEVRSATLSPQARVLEDCIDKTLRAFRVPRVPEPGAVAGVVRLVRTL